MHRLARENQHPVRVVAAVVGSAAVSSSSPPTNAEALVQEDQPRPSRSVQAAPLFQHGAGERFGCLVLGDGSHCRGAGPLRRSRGRGPAVLASRQSRGSASVSRVSLSPKHSVYLLRAGRRLLLVGAGPQGAPALISELDDYSRD